MMIRKVAKTTAVTGRPLTEKEAAALTVRIRKAADNVWSLLLEAREREAWKALRYATWEAYVNAEFAMSRRNSYRLLDLGRVVREIEEFVPHAAQITQRDVAAIKDDLPAVKAEISARVQEGEEPEKAATDIIAEKRAVKEAAKIVHERQRDEHRAALPDAIKQREQARADAMAKQKSQPGDGLAEQDHIAALEEEVRVLEAENASYRADIAKFGPIRVQFEQGGFEKILADKDEVIRTLETRLYSESADKASWMKSAKYWQAEAQKLGWSGTITIDIDAGDPTNG
ncbi:hypothetical protein LB517_10735 [Mesorhizobium sp. BR1-1-12]|uniref:hypothetical protein n=1 Tax=unclassified Mesorhizobium TaxID=325217 RepID=UPI001CCBB4EC|nr:MULTISPECIES: hypothetical protein [unclassified Mesorhizobium]MBZ9919112.1 hypothetical protein [Mesorhizobium sp. BR1-1-7]MBZ9970109.1 hypothetical protein [Mesorhizobium sp. BR1-1-12]